MLGDTTQRPAAILRVFVRLEDEGAAEDDEAQAEDEPFSSTAPHAAQRLKALNDQLATARATHDTHAQAIAKRSRDKLEKEVAAEKRGTQAPPGALDDDLFVLKNIIIVPIDASAELNGFRTADKLTATFPFAALPLTSRIIRSCLVEAYAGVVPAQGFASPTAWRLPFDRTTILFRGYVDEWKTEHKEGEATVRIEARSMEAILIDQKVNKLSPVYQVGRVPNDAGHTTVLKSELVTQYLNRFFATLPNVNGALGGDKLVAKFDSRGQEPSIDRKLFMRALQTAQSQNQAQGAVPGQPPPAQELPTLPPDPGTAEGTGVAKVQQPHAGAETSAWDIVTIACELVGCIPVYDPARDPDAIIVTLPQTVYDDGNPSPDGFERSVTDPSTGQSLPTQYRLMVWGRNIKEMSTSRKLGRIKSPAIEVVSINNAAKAKDRVLRARFPDTKAATRIGAKGKNKTNEVLTQVVFGVRDLEQLRQIAVGLYHQRGRHETSIHIVTDSLTSYQDDKNSLPNDPDLLRLRPGTAVKVLVARLSQDPDEGLNLTPLSNAFGQDAAQLRNFLADQFQKHSAGYETSDQGLGNLDTIAQRVADANDLQKTRNLYYVRTINHKFSKDSGWSADMEVVTFARVTADPEQMSAKDKATNNRLKTPRGHATAAKTTTQVANERAARVAGNKELP